MKTVRLSMQLQDDILDAATKKYENANPEKEYPQDGYAVLQRLGVVDKTIKTQQMFKEIWTRDLPMREIDRVIIKATQVEPDEDDEGNTHERHMSYSLTCPPTDVPRFLASYDEIEMDVPATDPTIVECYGIQQYNNEIKTKKRAYQNKLKEVMARFSTLNQLLKAAPYIQDLVPQEKLTKMHEKDDRSGRRAELAEVADTELSELRETLLEDALLGDDQ
tara:strand:+ start:822 stop:1481 length:660 start_codon:yes stop_codon:yes gene_type:complete